MLWSQMYRRSRITPLEQWQKHSAAATAQRREIVPGQKGGTMHYNTTDTVRMTKLAASRDVKQSVTQWHKKKTASIATDYCFSVFSNSRRGLTAYTKQSNSSLSPPCQDLSLPILPQRRSQCVYTNMQRDSTAGPCSAEPRASVGFVASTSF